MNIKIAENLQLLRKQKKMTQEEIANLFGVTSQSVSKWELGLSCPDITLLPEIAQFYEVSVDELLGVKQITSINSIYLDIKSLVDAAKTREEKHKIAYTIALLTTTCQWDHEQSAAEGVLKGNNYVNMSIGQSDGGITCKGYNSVFTCLFEEFPEINNNTIRKIHKYLSSINKINTLRVLAALFKMSLESGIRKSFEMKEIVERTGILENDIWAAFNDLNIHVEYDEAGTELWSLSCLNEIPVLLNLLIPLSFQWDINEK